MKLEGVRQKVFLDRYSLKDKEGNPMEETPEEMWARVAKGIAKAEKPNKRAKWEKKFYTAMEDFKFLPGGRILAGAGTGYDVTYYNCFVIPSPADSRDGILDNLKSMIEIMARGGGVGVNLSSLRPRGARVKKVNGFSSGPMNWAELYSLATKDIVQQGGCFAADTKIMTHRGLIPIQELVERKGNYYAATHRGYKKISAKFNNGVKKLYQLTTDAGHTVRTTGEHRFLTFDENGRFYLKPLSDFKVGDHVVHLLGDWVDELPYAILNTNLPMPSKYSYGLKEISLPKVLHEDLAFILGAYDSDGSRIPDEYNPLGKGIRIAVANNQPEDLLKLISAIRRCFKIEPKIRKGDGAVTIIQVFSRRLNEFLKLNGLLKESSVTVSVPEHIFTSPRTVVEAYIAGVFLGDGTNRGGKGGLRICTVSQGFARDLQLLLLNLGIPAKIKVQVRKENNWRTLYTVTVNGATFMKRFINLLLPYIEKVFDNKISIRDGFFGWPFNMVERFIYVPKFQRTQARNNPTTSQKSVLLLQQMVPILQEVDKSDIEFLGNCVPDKISSINYVGEENVYDLEVEDVHLLSGNGFYTSNSRRGALMIMLHDWHPDIEEFITVKQDLSRLNGANLSVCVSDALMEAVKKDADWELMFPDLDDPIYDTRWNGELDEWRKAGGKVKVQKRVKAKYLWDLICTAAWRSAEPGLHFLERSNKRSNTWWFEKLIATNPSLRAGTRVLTKEGIFPIEQLEGKKFLVKNLNGSWSPAECFLSGKNKPLYRITLNNGKEIYATPEHKWPVALIGGGFGKVTTDKLQAGNILPFPKTQDIEFDSQKQLSRNEGFMIGWLYGDGWISERGSKNSLQAPLQTSKSGIFPSNYRNLSLQVRSSYTNSLAFPKILSHDLLIDKNATKRKEMVFGFLFSEEDKPLAGIVTQEVNKLKTVRSKLTKAHGNTYTIQSTSFEFAQNLATIFGVNKKEHGFPHTVWTSGGEFIKGFIDGLISSDGFIAKNAYRIVFTTKHKKIADELSSLLSFYGIKSHVRKSEATVAKFPNGKNYAKIYERYDVNIDGFNAVMFGKIFTLSHPRKQALLQRIVNDHKTSRALPDHELIRIKSVEKTNIKENVWDISVYDDTHCFYIEHAVTGNCGEQPLSAWAVCNLGAMNLAAYVKDEQFDYKRFGGDVRTAIRFLDNVIDETYYFLPENEKCAKDIRRTGLGILGLGDALIKMKLRYGSDESLPVIRKIFETLRDNAYEQSSDIAAEKGSFPQFDKKKYLQGWHIKQLPKKIRDKIAKQGIRNAVLLTIAPTGTTSLISGVTSGIEPVYEFEFIRHDRLGEHKMYHPLYDEWRKNNPDAPRPPYFVSANDLTPMEHAKVQAIAQEYIDSSISKTVNAPNNHTVEDVKQLYMASYDMGLKGVTYMRDGSRAGVLERVEQKKDKQEEAKPEGKPEVKPQPAIIRRPMVVTGVTYQTQTPIGHAFITLNSDKEGNPFEVFITIGKSGSDVMAMAEALGRMVSAFLRLQSPVESRERIKEIIDQLSGIGGGKTVGFGENRVRSLPDALAKVLAEHFGFKVNGKVMDDKTKYSNGQEKVDLVNEISSLNGNGSADAAKSAVLQQLPLQSQEVHASMFDFCPSCGVASLAYEEGCKKCYSCGYSEC